VADAFRGQCDAGEDEGDRQHAFGVAEAVRAAPSNRAADQAERVKVERTGADDTESDEEPTPNLGGLARDEARDSIER
jgi:hypothetical protein